MKEENEDEKKAIKEEPVDNISLFDNIDMAFGENFDVSDNLVDLLRNAKTEELYSDSSGSLEYRKKRKLKKQAVEFKEYELMGWES